MHHKFHILVDDMFDGDWEQYQDCYGYMGSFLTREQIEIIVQKDHPGVKVSVVQKD